MADLGNLFFSLGLDTKDIDTAWDKALKKYGQKAQVDLKLNVGDLKTIKAQYAELNAKNKLAQDTEQRGKMNALKLTREQLKTEELINTQKARTQAVQDRTTASIHRTNSALSQQNRLYQNLNTMAASYLSLFAAGRLARELVTITGEFESQKVALQAILGDLNGANKIFDQIKQLAVKSPFQFKDLVSYTKQLSAFSIPMNELYDTTKMLADVSAGLGVGMDRLVLAYGQIRAASVLRGQEVRQLTEAGIPVIEELRKKFEELGETGLTAADIFDKISARLVPFEMIKEMFADMTSEGGKFFQMQEIQAETLKGKVSNLVDAYQIMFAEIGGRGEGALKWGVDTLRVLMVHYEAIGKLLATLVAAYGVYHTSLLITAAANGTLMASNNLLITSFIATRKALQTLTLAMSTNPYLALALAVTTVIGTMWALSDSTTAAEKAQAKLSDTMKNLEETKQKMKTEVNSLVGTITGETSSVYEQVKAWDELIKRYVFFSNYSIDQLRGMSDEEKKSLLASFFQTDSRQSIQNLFDAKRKEVQELETLYGSLSSKAMDWVSGTFDVEMTFGAGDKMAADVAKRWRVAKEELKAIAIQLDEVNRLEKEAEFQAKPEEVRIAILNARQEALLAQKKLIESDIAEGKTKEGMMASINKQIKETSAALSKFKEGEVRKNKEYWEKQKSDAESVLDGFEDTTLRMMRAGRFEGIKPELVGAYKKAVAEIRQADKVLGIYDYSDKEQKKQQEKEQEDAIRLLQQRLDYLEKVKKAYQDLVATLGAGNEDIAARFVNNLFGTTFTTQDFGTNFKSTIEPIIGQLSLLGDKGKEAADKMRISLDEAMKSDAVKEYTDTIKSQNRAREDANKLLTEQRAKEGDLNRLIEERDYKMSEIADTEENAAELRDAIFNDYKQKILEIGKEWLKTLGLEGDATDFIKSKIKDIIPLFKSIDKLNLSELRELSNMLDKLQIDPKTLEFLKLFGIDVEKLNEAIKNAAKTTKEEQVDPEKWKRIVGYVNMYADALSDIGQELEGMGGAWGEIGGAIVGVVSQAENLVTALDDGAKKEDKIGAGLSALSSIIVMFINQAEKNKQAQEEWNLSIIDGVHQMSLMRIEAEAYKEANLFGVENPYAKAIAGAKRYAVAMAELNKVVAAGSVQTGTKKVVSGKNVATGAGAGAAIGAVVGTVIPVIGNLVGAAVGAVVGAIVGLFATKTVPIFESLSSQYGQIFNEKFELNPEILANYKKLDEATKQLVDNWEEIRKKALEAEEEMRTTFKELAGDMGSQLSDALVNAFRNGDIYSAVDDYKQYVSNVIGDIISQLIFAAQFGELFNELEQRFNESFKAGGDQDIVDDIMWFTTAYQDKIDAYNKAMEAAQKTLGAQGIDILKPEQEGKTQSSTLGGAIQASVTENTANLLGGYINGIRADGAKRTMLAEQMLPLVSNINDTMGNGLAHLAAISSNTFRTANGIDRLVEKVDALTTPNGATRLNAVIKTN